MANRSLQMEAEQETESLSRFFFFPSFLPPLLLSLKLHIIWSGTSLRESLTKPLHGASGQNLLQFMFSPSALPLPAFCFLSVHPISQMKLNLVCSVSNSLFLSLFSFPFAALLPCSFSALQPQVVFYVALEHQHILGLPLFFPVTGLLPSLWINKCKQWAGNISGIKMNWWSLVPILRLWNCQVGWFYSRGVFGTEGAVLFCSEARRYWGLLLRDPNAVLKLNSLPRRCRLLSEMMLWSMMVSRS